MIAFGIPKDCGCCWRVNLQNTEGGYAVNRTPLWTQPRVCRSGTIFRVDIPIVLILSFRD
jgi:hypothetical protein